MIENKLKRTGEKIKRTETIIHALVNERFELIGLIVFSVSICGKRGRSACVLCTILFRVDDCIH